MASLGRHERSTNIWPGFVDALATLLMVIIFLLLIFVFAQFFLGQALSGRDSALQRLESQVSELADLLSLEKYQEGEYWFGHSQFLQQFLNPLLLRSIKGINFNDWYRGNLDGIKTSDLNEILNFKDKLSFNVFFSVVLLSRFENKNKKNPKEALKKIKNKKSLSKNSYKSMLIQLRNWIKKLEPLKKKQFGIIILMKTLI